MNAPEIRQQIVRAAEAVIAMPPEERVQFNERVNALEAQRRLTVEALRAKGKPLRRQSTFEPHMRLRTGGQNPGAPLT